MSDTHHARPVVLAILDGWGMRADHRDNAVALAKTPIYDRLSATSPRTLLSAAGEAVGLPPGAPGNAQAGHRTIAQGRAVEQDIGRLADIMTGSGAGSISENPVLRQFVQKLRAVGGAAHLIGLLSPAGVHGHQTHMAVLAALLAHEGIDVWIHAIADGQDAPPQSGITDFAEFLGDISGAEQARLASISGRRFAMDRPGNWAQMATCYRAITDADAPAFDYGPAYLDACYKKGWRDAEVPPAISPAYRGIRPDDAVCLVNFRTDQSHRLMAALASPEFTAFERSRDLALSGAYSLTAMAGGPEEYVTPFFAPHETETTMGDALADAGKRQLHIAETINRANLEIFARGADARAPHGTTLFVAETPEIEAEKEPALAAFEITARAVEAIKAQADDLIVVNYANAALLGGGGNLSAAIDAVECLDKCLGKLAAMLEKRGGVLLVTSAFGNAEDMSDAPDRAAGANTRANVPLLLVSPKTPLENAALRTGTLADIAPTVLGLLGVTAPPQMTGGSLIVPADEESRVPA